MTIVVMSFASINGCVPTPNESASIPPLITDLHFFFTPEQTDRTFLWRHIPLASLKDSMYFIEYIRQGSSITSEGYSPISLFKYSDTLRKDSVINESYISDSLVVLYFGKSNDRMTPRLLMLHDTLRVGASWIAADNFPTSNGVRVSIKAIVEDYYPETSSAGNTYQDVFLVSYTSSVKDAGNPVEPEFQNRAHMSRYFARGIGDILERCVDSRDSLVWTNELVETRIH